MQTPNELMAVAAMRDKMINNRNVLSTCTAEGLSPSDCGPCTWSRDSLRKLCIENRSLEVRLLGLIGLGRLRRKGIVIMNARDLRIDCD